MLSIFFHLLIPLAIIEAIPLLLDVSILNSIPSSQDESQELFSQDSNCERAPNLLRRRQTVMRDRTELLSSFKTYVIETEVPLS